MDIAEHQPSVSQKQISIIKTKIHSKQRGGKTFNFIYNYTSTKERECIHSVSLKSMQAFPEGVMP